MATNPFQDHLQNRGNGGGSVNDNRNKGGGNNNKNKRNNNGKNNNNNKNHGGGGGGDLIPDLPAINPGLGLDAPNTGTLGGNPFDISTSMTASPPPAATPRGNGGTAGYLPTTPPAPPASTPGERGTTGAPGLPTPAAPPLYSDENDYEHTWFQQNPQAGYNAFLQEAGLNPGAADAYGQWLKRQYDQMFANYDALRSDDQNQSLSWFDYLGGLTGAQTPYGSPGWRDAFRNYLTLRYRNSSLDDRGLNYSPYEGPSRVLYFGN